MSAQEALEEPSVSALKKDDFKIAVTRNPNYKQTKTSKA